MFATDLAIAIFTIGTLSLLAFLCGRRVRANRKWLFVITILVAVVFSNWFQGNLGWAWLVPHSAAVLLSNFTPILVALIIGYSSNGLELRPKSRPIAVFVLSCIAFICLLAPVIRPAIAPPKINLIGETRGIVVMQSHEATCAPASAATLLKLHGIHSSEKEMVGPCLTSEFGTEALGLYRGLKLAIHDQKRTICLAGKDPCLWTAQGQLPNVALVRFPGDEFSQAVDDDRSSIGARRPSRNLGSRFSEDGHAVVLVEYKDQMWTVADPAVGLVTWSDEVFRARFTGDALYISNR